MNLQAVADPVFQLFQQHILLAQKGLESEALEENVLTEDEARQLAIDVAKLSALMRREK